jgi:hypothetical protein
MEKTLIESTEALFNNALETMKKKNADYSGDKESMKNFRISAEVAQVKMSQGILTRLCDKVTRIGNLMNTEAKVKEETIFDTIQDLINYAAILHYSLQVEREESATEFYVDAASVRDLTPKQIIEEFKRGTLNVTKIESKS